MAAITAGDVIAAVAKVYDASNLTNTIPGGLHTGIPTNPEGIYAVLDILGSIRHLGTSASTFGMTTARFRIEGQTGLEDTSNAAGDLRDVFDDADLDLDIAGGLSLYMRWQNELPVKIEDATYPNAWRYDVTFDVLTKQDS